MEAIDISPGLAYRPADVSVDGAAKPATELPPDRFLDRELSWLAFNNRVLDLAKDSLRVPLLERARFLAIFSSNLDEFYMVRVAGLKRRIAAGVAVPTVAGMMPREVHTAILNRTRELVAEQARVFTEDVRPALASEGIEILRWDHDRGREGPDERALRRADLPGADPARRRPVTPVPLHLRPVHQPCRAGAQPRPVPGGSHGSRCPPCCPGSCSAGAVRTARGRHREAP